jgi:hypothetical protein
MTTPPHLREAVGIGALLIFLLSLTYFVFSWPTRIELGAPTFAGGAVDNLLASATPPEIGDFAKFHVNDENPFVPYSDRIIEVQAKNPIKNQPQPRPPIVPPVQQEPKQLPTLGQGASVVPECLGLAAHENGNSGLMVRMKGSTQTTVLKVGEEISGWKLLSVSTDLARFTDPSGAEQTFVIAPGVRTTELSGLASASSASSGMPNQAVPGLPSVGPQPMPPPMPMPMPPPMTGQPPPHPPRGQYNPGQRPTLPKPQQDSPWQVPAPPAPGP